jgi:hypothetical protein
MGDAVSPSHDWVQKRHMHAGSRISLMDKMVAFLVHAVYHNTGLLLGQIHGRFEVDSLLIQRFPLLLSER